MTKAKTIRKKLASKTGTILSSQKLPPYIILPGLRAHEDAGFPGHRLDPGLDDAPAPFVYRPAYPLAPAEARKRLARMRAEGLAELETLRHGIDLAADAENFKLNEELADLASFAGIPEKRKKRRDEIDLERAQEWLLRIWLMEEKALDIAKLDAECRRASASLTASFEEGAGTVSEFPAELDPSLLPNWRVCVKNAMYFCPPELPYLVEGAMERDLAEIFNFSPANEIDEMIGDGFLVLVSPLWKILGGRAPIIGDGVKAEVFNCSRIWLRRAKDEKC